MVAVAFLAACAVRVLAAQTPSPRIHVRVIVSSAGRPLDDVQIRSGARATMTGDDGSATLVLGPGPHDIVASRIGFTPDTLHVVLAAAADTTLRVELIEAPSEIAGIVVSATRRMRRVEDEPTRVEIVAPDEVEEKTAESPRGVAEMLSETGGVHVAVTSPAFGAEDARIQGLRGRYVQVLSDGLPLAGLTTDGLGLLQIPPMDLDHVELIKGAASALYGPTALGGVVNLVSRRPTETPTGQLVLNQTSHDGTDLEFYGSRRTSSALGFSLLAGAHRQAATDLNGDGWADLAGYQRVVLTPRLFWNDSAGRSVAITGGFTGENRSGGGRVPGHSSFTEAVRTRRADLGIVATVPNLGAWRFVSRSSVTEDWRRLAFDTSLTSGRRETLFEEASLGRTFGDQDVVLGVAVERDAFTTPLANVGYAFTAPGVFVQHTWTPGRAFAVTTSLRLDHHSAYGSFLSPRVSVLVRPLRTWSVRLSGGGGAFGPTPFVDETEEIGLARMRPFQGRLVAERSRSFSADVGGMVGPVEVDASAFASVIDHPVQLASVAGSADSVQLENMTGATHTAGTEVFLTYRRLPFTIIGSYAYLDASEQSPETGLRRGVPLTPRNSGSLALSWEPEEDIGVAVEGSYTGRQPLAEDPYRTQSLGFLYLETLIRYRFGRVGVFVNGENLTDVRQTRFDPLLRPTPGLGGRWTTDAWAPLEGRVFNAGAELYLP